MKCEELLTTLHGELKFTCPSAAETGDGVISLCIRCRQPCHSLGAASRSVTSRERRLPARPPARLRASQRAYARIERTNERTRNARDIAGLARCVLFASSPLSRLGIVLKRTKMRGDMANWTTAFVEHAACGIKAFENHALYRFSAFWLRSSVVSVLISLMLFPVLHLIKTVEITYQIVGKNVKSLLE